ncbi:hypothetical protein [Arundinibacter roseus]|uniref:Lipoprotein n=1 Tax=Arundinibacter roseus TaxID=2070510 RepID=A0A4R4K1F5_9BACT|nr:hypothetical protein [Arundinibacter roseus]TDB59809.1 hypothetical protein EZE20_21880 [Arundinibacter roseus]
MKLFIKKITGPVLLSVLMLASCSPSEKKEAPDNKYDETVQDSNDETKSRKAMGVGEGNQNETEDYPLNQGNLYPDSTREDTIR